MTDENGSHVRGDALERANRAWELRISGMPWKQVAEMTGFAHASSAQNAVKAVYGSNPAVDREQLRDLWRARLEVLWSQTISDIADRIPGATTAGVRIIQAAAQLDGLNQPTKVAVSGFDGYLSALTEELNREGF